MTDHSERSRKLRSLSPREWQVFRLKCEGYTHAEIGVALVIALPTVKSHIARIYEKLDLDAFSSARRHVELSRYAEVLRDDLAPPRQALPERAIPTALAAEPEPDAESIDVAALVAVLEDEIALLEERTLALQVLPTDTFVYSPDAPKRSSPRRATVTLILLACSLVGGLLGAGLMWALVRPKAPVIASVDVRTPEAFARGNAPIVTPTVAPVVVSAAATSESAPVCGETQRVSVPAPPLLRSQGVVVHSPENTQHAVLSQWARAVLIDKRGVWAGYFATDQGGRGGVSQFNRVGWVDCALPGEGAERNVNALVIDAAGRLWVGSERGGVSMWTGAGWRTYRVQDGLPSNEIYGLTVDQHGNIWASTWEGVAKFDGERWTAPYRVETRTIFSNHAHAVAFDGAGNIWVGHIEDGVSQYRQVDGKWIHHQLGDSDGLGGNTVRGIVVRPPMNGAPESIWFATADGGVSKFENGKWTVYRSAQGLPSDSVSGVALDKYGRVWAATTRGAAYFDGNNWISYTTLPTLSIAFGPRCEGCPYGDEHIWTGTEQLGLTVSRLPYPDSPLDIVSIEYYDISGALLPQPLTLIPGQQFRAAITVRPRVPYQLSEERGDMLVHADADDHLRFGAYEHMAVKGVIEPGQPFTFVDYDNYFTAPSLEPGERQRTFVSTWRVWMRTRYAGPPVELAFTVRAP